MTRQPNHWFNRTFKPVGTVGAAGSDVGDPPSSGHGPAAPTALDSFLEAFIRLSPDLQREVLRVILGDELPAPHSVHVRHLRSVK
jgi:hypothetical protein